MRLPILCLTFVLAATAAHAAPPVRTISEHAKEVAARIDAEPVTVREAMIESLRLSGKFSEDDLNRVGRGRAAEPEMQQAMLEHLLADHTFRKQLTGLASAIHPDIATEAGKIFETLREDVETTDREVKTPGFPVAKSEQVPLVRKRAVGLNGLVIGEAEFRKISRLNGQMKSVRDEIYVRGQLLRLTLAGKKGAYSLYFVHPDTRALAYEFPLFSNVEGARAEAFWNGRQLALKVTVGYPEREDVHYLLLTPRSI